MLGGADKDFFGATAPGRLSALCANIEAAYVCCSQSADRAVVRWLKTPRILMDIFFGFRFR
jgi:hypothetical protein